MTNLLIEWPHEAPPLGPSPVPTPTPSSAPNAPVVNDVLVAVDDGHARRHDRSNQDQGRIIHRRRIRCPGIFPTFSPLLPII